MVARIRTSTGPVTRFQYSNVLGVPGPPGPPGVGAGGGVSVWLQVQLNGPGQVPVVLQYFDIFDNQSPTPDRVSTGVYTFTYSVNTILRAGWASDQGELVYPDFSVFKCWPSQSNQFRLECWKVSVSSRGKADATGIVDLFAI